MKKFIIVLGAILICGMMAGCKNQKSDNQNETTTIEESVTPEPSYEGVYLDEDNNEPNLYITRRDDGKYDVRIGIFRLTDLDDGIGTIGTNGMEFTATDAAGNPIGGEIWRTVQHSSTFDSNTKLDGTETIL